MYIVISSFKDLQDNEHIYEIGDIYPHEGKDINEITKERIEELKTSKNKKGRILIKELDLKEDVKQNVEKEITSEEEKENQGTEETASEEEKENPETEEETTSEGEKANLETEEKTVSKVENKKTNKRGAKSQS